MYSYFSRQPCLTCGYIKSDMILIVKFNVEHIVKMKYEETDEGHLHQPLYSRFQLVHDHPVDIGKR